MQLKWRLLESVEGAGGGIKEGGGRGGFQAQRQILRNIGKRSNRGISQRKENLCRSGDSALTAGAAAAMEACQRRGASATMLVATT